MSNAETTRDRTVAEWRRITLTRAIHAVLAASGMRSSDGNNQGKSQGTKTMSNEMMKREAEIGNVQSAAQEDAGFEKILKFKKGRFYINEETVELGTEFIAHVRGWTKCWIKFVDGEVAERKMYRVALGEKPPQREELDDQDESNWPEGLDGKPADPWVIQYLLPLENPSSGEVVIFVTPSSGGRRAVADLCKEFVKRTKKVANCGQPIVKLATTTFYSKKFKTEVDRPNFVVVGWDEPSADSDVEVMPPSSSSAPPASSKNDLNDTIPF